MAVRKLGVPQTTAGGFTKPPSGKPEDKKLRKGPPLPVGVQYRVPDEKSMLPSERELLKSLDWQPGQPVPLDLPQILAASSQDAISQVATRFEQEAEGRIPDVQGLEQYEEVSIDDLSDEHQAAIADLVSQAEAPVVAPKRTASKLIKTLPEATRQRAKRALAAAQRQMAADVEESKEYKGVDPGVRRVLQQTEQVDDQAEAEAPAADSTGLTTSHTHCLRCGFPADQLDLIQITEEDKTLWLQSLVSDQPYRKKLYYYGNKVAVALRLLCTDENDAIVAQIRRDLAEKRYDDRRIIEHQHRYTVALSLVWIDPPAPAESIEFPASLQAWSGAAENALDSVRSVYEAVYTGDGPLRSAAMERIVNQAVRDFMALTHKLESLAYATDF
jgi:hypothetical protein